MKTNKSLFENTPTSKLCLDWDDVKSFVSRFRKPRDVVMNDKEIDELFKRDKDMGRDIDLEDK